MTESPAEDSDTSQSRISSGQDEPKRSQNSFSKLRNAWKWLDIDLHTFLQMVKFALPPTIGLCIFQSDSISSTFTTVGYLVAVGGVLASTLTPRAAFLQNIIVDVFAISVATAVALLAMWSAIQARKHTTAPGSPLSDYNSSAAAVVGVWLFATVYFINCLKSAMPQFRFAYVMASIIIIVTLASAPQITEVDAALRIARQLFGALLLGLAIATGISLLFRPSTSRKLVLRNISDYLTSIRKVLEAQSTFLKSIENKNMFHSSSESESLRSELKKLRLVNNKLFSDMKFAKKEIAYGYLEAKDLSEIHRLLRAVFLPIAGMNQMIDIFERLAKMHGWSTLPRNERTDPETESERIIMGEYEGMMQALHSPVGDISNSMYEAIDHVSTVLKLANPVPQPADEEADSTSSPGHDGFSQYLEGRIDLFDEKRKIILKSWVDDTNVTLSPVKTRNSVWLNTSVENDDFFATHKQRQLFVLLYILYLYWASSQALLKLVQFADTRFKKGTMSKQRFLFPGRKNVKKFLRLSSMVTKDEDDDCESAPDPIHDLGEAFHSRKDPEHLPAEGWLQEIGEILRAIANMFRSKHSSFGFRVACAIMSVAVLSLIRQTQHFYVEQRIFWGAIYCALSMVRTAGQSMFIFFLRVCGILVGAAAAYPVFYITDGHSPGVLVIYFLCVTMFAYIPVKAPRLALVGIMATVTTTIIIGYELQVKKIGQTVATSNDQKYYPLYLLAPYRAVVCMAGIAVAFIFTGFPFPISERSEVRKYLGTALYLGARHHAVVQATITARIHRGEGDMKLKTSPGRRLETERTKLFTKQLILVSRLRELSDFTKWQVPLDARFPKATYDSIINVFENLCTYTALIGYASTSFVIPQEGLSEEHSAWQITLTNLLKSLQHTADDVSSVLCLLSSSILNAQPLPPHLRLPRPYELVKRLQTMDRDVLDVEHVAEPAYSGFAIMQIASKAVIADLRTLTDLIRELVGELDFSY
ncbi:uncharacterized protein BDZ99DRAFT_418542, partial [Mytilinidion resinicola]